MRCIACRPQASTRKPPSIPTLCVGPLAGWLAPRPPSPSTQVSTSSCRPPASTRKPPSIPTLCVGPLAGWLAPLAPVPVQEVGDDAALTLVDCRIERFIRGVVLHGLTERVDRLLMMALRLQRVSQAAPRFGIPELEVGPGAADLGCAAPIPGLQHARTFPPKKRKPGLP